MCDVCAATAALKPGGCETWWEPGGRSLHMEARGAGPECEPGVYRLRLDGGPWTPWAETPDLAGVAGILGLDVKWPYVHERTKRVLAGKRSLESLLPIIHRRQQDTLRALAESETIYTFTRGQMTFLSTSPTLRGAMKYRLACIDHPNLPEGQALVRSRAEDPWTAVPPDEAVRFLVRLA